MASLGPGSGGRRFAAHRHFEPHAPERRERRACRGRSLEGEIAGRPLGCGHLAGVAPVDCGWQGSDSPGFACMFTLPRATSETADAGRPPALAPAVEAGTLGRRSWGRSRGQSGGLRCRSAGTRALRHPRRQHKLLEHALNDRRLQDRRDDLQLAAAVRARRSRSTVCFGLERPFVAAGGYACFGSGPADQPWRKESLGPGVPASRSRVTGAEGRAVDQRLGLRMTGR